MHRISNYISKFLKRKKLSKSIDFGRNVNISTKVTAEGGNSIDHFSILEGGVISIGKYSTISSHCILRGPIQIGRYSQLGPNVSIFTRNHPLQSISINVSRNFMSGQRKMLQRELQKEVQIGSDVWIGAGVVILPGVSIGDGAVIASGAVVNQDVEPYSIIGGIPAREIRMRYNQDVIDKLLEIKWWFWSDDKIAANSELFLRPRITSSGLDIFFSK